MRAISLGYHDILDPKGLPFLDPRGATSAYSVHRAEFRSQLQAIARTSASSNVVTIQQARKWDTQVPVFMSFDDGQAGAYTCAAEELEECGWRGHFFITTSWIDRPGFLSRTQIRELHARGHVIASHTVSHPSRMSELPWDSLLREWRESIDTLSEILGTKIEVASVADGYYSRRVGLSAAAAGIRVLFNSEPTSSTSFVEDCLILGRYAVQAQTREAEIVAIAKGEVWPRWKQSALWSIKGVAKSVGGQQYLNLRRRLLAK